MSPRLTLPFTVDDRGHRRFGVGGRTFRAFWSTGSRRWTVIPTDPATGDNLMTDERHRFENWRALQHGALHTSGWGAAATKGRTV